HSVEIPDALLQRAGGERAFDERARLDEPTVDDQPTLPWVHAAGDAADAVRDARIEDREAVESGRHHAQQLRGLDAALALEARPVVEHVVLEQEGLAAPEGALLPAGEAEDPGPLSMRQVAVGLLFAAVDVAAEPRRGDVVAAQDPPSPPHQALVKGLVEGGGEVVPRRRPQEGVLIRDVPEVPDEAVAAGLARVGETLVEVVSQGLRFGSEGVHGHHGSAHGARTIGRNGRRGPSSVEGRRSGTPETLRRERLPLSRLRIGCWRARSGAQ